MPEVIDYGPIIAELERKRDELTRTIEVLRAIAGMPTLPGGPTSGGGGLGGGASVGDRTPELRSDAFFGMKAPEAIKAYLNIVKQPKTVREIADGLEQGGFLTSAKAFYNNLYTALVRMQRDGEVVQLPQKRWGLADWYPARAKQKQKSEGSNDKGSDSGSVAEPDGETAA